MSFAQSGCRCTNVRNGKLPTNTQNHLEEPSGHVRRDSYTPGAETSTLDCNDRNDGQLLECTRQQLA